jgi:hypothetical protein
MEQSSPASLTITSGDRMRAAMERIIMVGIMETMEMPRAMALEHPRGKAFHH